ncbi:cystatin-A isoform X3 [Penaeus vannamei]|uniref:cystatin-A isoform X3 n=1 Tax=Penaeus vannamei TaxID=6689 RepID=UPI00387F9BB7
MMMAGGISDAKPFSEEVQQLLEAVKSELEEKLGKKLDRFQLVSYKTQVVAGTNYFAKMDIGGEELVHMRVYRNLQGEVSLHSHQHPKTREEDIVYF